MDNYLDSLKGALTHQRQILIKDIDKEREKEILKESG